VPEVGPVGGGGGAQAWVRLLRTVWSVERSVEPRVMVIVLMGRF